MAHRIIDLLEAVEIEKQGGSVAAPIGIEMALHPGQQPASVRQAGQTVGIGGIGQRPRPFVDAMFEVGVERLQIAHQFEILGPEHDAAPDGGVVAAMHQQHHEQEHQAKQPHHPPLMIGVEQQDRCRGEHHDDINPAFAQNRRHDAGSARRQRRDDDREHILAGEMRAAHQQRKRRPQGGGKIQPGRKLVAPARQLTRRARHDDRARQTDGEAIAIGPHDRADGEPPDHPMRAARP